MRKSPKFSPEMREHAVRIVQEHRGEHPSQWAAIESIPAKVGWNRELRKANEILKLASAFFAQAEPGRRLK